MTSVSHLMRSHPMPEPEIHSEIRLRSFKFKEITMNTKTNYQTLIAQINQQVEELAQATDAARMSEDMVRYLDAFSSFIGTVVQQHG